MSQRERSLLRKAYPIHDVIMASVDIGKKIENRQEDLTGLRLWKLQNMGSLSV